MEETPEGFWMEVYEQYRRYLRYLVGAVFLLGFVAIFDGFANHTRVAEEYQVAVDIILDEQREETLKEEIKRVFENVKNAEIANGNPVAEEVTVDMRAIRPLHRRYVRTLAGTQNQTYSIGGQSVGLHAYVVALNFGPLLLVMAMIWPLISIRKLHRRLAASARPQSAIQQKLNSLFFNRVTAQYGEHWRRHVLLSILAIFVLAIGTPLIFISTRSIVSASLLLKINGDGQVFALDDDPLISRLVVDAGDDVAILILVIGFLTMVSMWAAARVALSVLSQRENPEDGNHGGQHTSSLGDDA